jgi:DNA-directed RNA polymerase specialized sigma subunit
MGGQCDRSGSTATLAATIRSRKAEAGSQFAVVGGSTTSISTRPASLDAPISDEDSTEFGEIVGDEHTQTPSESVGDKNLRDEVSDLLEVLDEREHKIIFHRSD